MRDKRRGSRSWAASAWSGGVVLAFLPALGACDRPPEAPVAGGFAIRVSPDPVVFRQLYPGAGALTLATPPPPDPRFYAATMTLLVSESQGGAGRLESVETALISRDGAVLAAGTYDGACDFANALTGGGNRAIPPHGQLEWCLARLATPDVHGQYTLRISPRIRDELGNVVVPSASFQVVFER